MTDGVVLYAPNVHTGGGLVLLQALLAAWPGVMPFNAFLDARARTRLVLPKGANVSWVTASVSSRLKAEFSLRGTAEPGYTLLCFHGLPPLLPSKAQVVVFQQNRITLGLEALSKFAWKTRLRLTCERILGRALRHRVSRYVVQTPAMRHAVMERYGSSTVCASAPVIILPFVDTLPEAGNRNQSAMEWDFVYVADGEAHKNHRTLLAAWKLLAKAGFRPSLALTLGSRDEALCREIESACAIETLHIRNLGQLPRQDVLELYAKARAMIFPSTAESFGLPLIEAEHMGLSILASELDFVRDVCRPAQTFDPLSPVSIARAVKRFLGSPDPHLTLRTPAQFWEALLGDGSR